MSEFQSTRKKTSQFHLFIHTVIITHHITIWEPEVIYYENHSHYSPDLGSSREFLLKSDNDSTSGCTEPRRLQPGLESLLDFLVRKDQVLLDFRVNIEGAHELNVNVTCATGYQESVHHLLCYQRRLMCKVNKPFQWALWRHNRLA